MLNRLKKHWEVKSGGLILILCTFAITGTVTAWLSKKVAEWLLFDKYGLAWWASKVIVLIFGYQVIILIVGFCFGMFPFFWKYEKKILKRFGFMKKETANHQPPAIFGSEPDTSNLTPHPTLVNIAVFASGAGTNAQKIITHFNNSAIAKVALIVCNNPKAGVLQIAAKENVPVLLLEKNKFSETVYVAELKDYQIAFIVLAGFLWKIPNLLIHAFPHRIVNIHPALLPAYGGKNMYGNAVHSAVINAKEKESGITIHFVDEHYDHGEIIFQARCGVNESDNAESLAQKIHQMEHRFYPEKIEEVIKKLDK
ncbi:MAG: phosphoribosylglycinamide formyltransferase [Ginsengibacter sp.]